MKKKFSLTQVCEQTGLNRTELQRFIEEEWIEPSVANEMDKLDLSRVYLILDLQRDFGANHEAIPLILHLVDQLHAFRNRLKTFEQDLGEE